MARQFTSAPVDERNFRLNLLLLDCLTQLIKARHLVKKPESRESINEARELVEAVLRNEATKPIKSQGHHGG